MKFIDLFAGIGGFRRGMELAGHECVGFCELDKFATASYTSMHLITEKQMKYLSTLDLKKRQKEILKDEYRNGEWYADDIRDVDAAGVPKCDFWCFGAPCQDFSIAGKRTGLDGGRSSLIREIFRLLREIREEDRPEWIIYENVNGMLSSNRGFDFLAILLEMDELGYDCEWQIFNSKDWGVPQNRERVYTVGHLRSRGFAKIFPVTGTSGEDNIKIKQMGQRDRPGRKNLNQYRVYDTSGLSPCLNAGIGEGGNLGPHIIICIIGGKNPCRNSDKDNNLSVKVSKIQENKQFGIYVQLSDDCTVYAVWYEKYECYIAIRKLTPKECFRLQGWTDDYFEKAKFVNSDSQLYKQVGNGVTVNVVYEIGKKLLKEMDGD